MPPLVRTDDVVDPPQLYGGDVIEHPVTGVVMTITAYMVMSEDRMDPSFLCLAPGVVQFDWYAQPEHGGPLDRDDQDEELVLRPGMTIRRLFRYQCLPGTRFR